MSIGNRIALGFGLSLLVLLVIAGVAFQGAQQLTTTTEGLLESHNNYKLLREVRALLVDAETGQRGYVLTGEEVYLRPYQAALSELRTDMDKLRVAMDKYPEQRSRMAKIEPLIANKLDELADTIRLRREQGFDASLAIVKTNRGQREMDAIRELIYEMRDTEEDRWRA
ncbi:CHASE3 domain-containing protein, partial [Corallococcus terminator]